jgi:periplasmic protein TonB
MYNNLRGVMNFDDILFKSRNRDYGAYQLRKRYNSVVTFSICAAILIVTFAVFIPFIRAPRKEHVFNGGYRSVNVKMENLASPQDFVIPSSPPPPVIKQVIETEKYIPPVVVDTVIPFEDRQLSNDELILQKEVTTEETGTTGSGSGFLAGEGGDGTGDGTGDAFFLVEVMPAFRGGDINKFREWVQKRTVYPQEAIDKKIQGKVYLTFIIETDGSVSNVTVVQSVNPLIDNEAVKAIESSPKWTPGLQRGRPVRVRFSMWLNFIY